MKELDEEVSCYLKRLPKPVCLMCVYMYIQCLRLLPLQCNARKSAEANVSLLEKDKLMLQHRSTEYQRKADQEGEKRRNLENEGLFILLFICSLCPPFHSRFCRTSLLVLVIAFCPSSFLLSPPLLSSVAFSCTPVDATEPQ